MTNLVALSATEDRRWKAAKLTRPFDASARHLVDPTAKARYKAVSSRTGVPWYVIAVIHMRECPTLRDGSPSFDHSLAQGDRWNQKSIHVPAGRGPFKSWEDCAVDALVNCAPYAARWKDWSIGGILTILEQYNGLGYANRGIASPYIWSGTDQYVRGKYVADGRFDPNAVDQQLGCAGLLMAMAVLDREVVFGATPANDNTATATTTNKPVVVAHPTAAPPPSITHPAPGSLGAWVASALAALFRKAA